MVDKTVPYYDVFMLHHNLNDVEVMPLPDGYSFRYFDGSQTDIDHWCEIEASSGDVESVEKAHSEFDRYYGNSIGLLKERCLFLLSSDSLPVGTATAYMFLEGQPGLPEPASDAEELPENVTGHLHWVAMREDYKGRGLSKPLITKTMQRMAELGHKKAFLHSQTPSWVACKIYLDLGWEPFRFVQSREDFTAGWNIVFDKAGVSRELPSS
ncbi:MAG: Acetyltransferase (GNAT) family protein [candidate division WS6 bacterium OLB20]|uniref:Acetyltransferase (GNAT) family protein n=1 Tax=candidate division WS6 bacterium OLB20 TaxID=1617426 RepID=A0A136LWY2_9BACT|nr:MAG: Acetyltransferase (GNAT) family protein [candidate division WS6 bacterium OLB20]